MNLYVLEDLPAPVLSLAWRPLGSYLTRTGSHYFNRLLQDINISPCRPGAAVIGDELVMGG